MQNSFLCLRESQCTLWFEDRYLWFQYHGSITMPTFGYKLWMNVCWYSLVPNVVLVPVQDMCCSVVNPTLKTSPRQHGRALPLTVLWNVLYNRHSNQNTRDPSSSLAKLPVKWKFLQGSLYQRDLCRESHCSLDPYYIQGTLYVDSRELIQVTAFIDCT